MAHHGNERFTIRRKVLKIFGASFHIYNPQGELIAFCKQKAFKFREDIRLFTDESMNEEFLTLKARQIIDFGVTLDVTLPDGSSLASLRRKGMKSTFLRDSWLVYGPDLGDGSPPAELATIEEDSAGLAFLRRYIDNVAMFLPQKFHVKRTGGAEIATLRTHFNPFVHRITVHVHQDDPEVDDLVLLAAGVLIAAIEGRQN